MRPSMWTHWHHLANTIELVLLCAHPSLQPKWQIDRFSRFCTAHGRKSLYFTMGYPFPQNSPLWLSEWVLNRGEVEGTVRHCQSKEASILWSYNEETRELPGERNNARSNARCMQARKTTHGLDRQHHVVDRTLCGRVSQNDRGET